MDQSRATTIDRCRAIRRPCGCVLRPSVQAPQVGRREGEPSADPAAMASSQRGPCPERSSATPYGATPPAFDLRRCHRQSPRPRSAPRVMAVAGATNRVSPRPSRPRQPYADAHEAHRRAGRPSNTGAETPICACLRPSGRGSCLGQRDADSFAQRTRANVWPHVFGRAPHRQRIVVSLDNPGRVSQRFQVCFVVAPHARRQFRAALASRRIGASHREYSKLDLTSRARLGKVKVSSKNRANRLVATALVDYASQCYISRKSDTRPAAAADGRRLPPSAQTKKIRVIPEPRPRSRLCAQSGAYVVRPSEPPRNVWKIASAEVKRCGMTCSLPRRHPVRYSAAPSAARVALCGVDEP